MKKILLKITYIALIMAFILPFFDENLISRIEKLLVILFFDFLSVIFLLWHWYSSIFKLKLNINESLSILESRFSSSPKIIVNYMPKISNSFVNKKFQSVNYIVSNAYFSGFYFGIFALGFSGQANLWLVEMSSLTSGVYGYLLNFNFGKAVFSVISNYLFIFGFSVFGLGCLAKFFYWRNE